VEASARQDVLAYVHLSVAQIVAAAVKAAR